MIRFLPSVACLLAAVLAAGISQANAQETSQSQDAQQRTTTDAEDRTEIEQEADTQDDQAGRQSSRNRSQQQERRTQDRQPGSIQDRQSQERQAQQRQGETQQQFRQSQQQDRSLQSEAQFERNQQFDNRQFDNRQFNDGQLDDGLDRRFDQPFEQRSDRQNYQFDQQFNQRGQDVNQRGQDFSVQQRGDWQFQQDARRRQQQQFQGLDLGAQLATGVNDQLIVREVTGGLAESIGLRENDVLLSVAGRDVTSIDQVETIIYRTDLASVQRIPVVVVRDGRRVVLYLEPDMLPYDVYRRDRGYYAGENAWLGVTLDTRYQDAAVVRNVVPDSPADSAGVRRGDMIVRVNGRQVASPEQLMRLIDAMNPGQEAEIEVVRRVSGTLYAQLEGEPRDQWQQAARPVYEDYQEERVELYQQPRNYQAEQQQQLYWRGEAAGQFETDQNRGVLNRLGPGEQGLRDRLDRDELPEPPALQRR